QVRHLVDRAIRIAKNYRTVTCIIVPNDVQELQPVEVPPRPHGTVHSGVGHSSTNIIPEEGELKKAARVLNEDKRVAILVVSGAFHAADEINELAVVTGAGVDKGLSGKTVLGADMLYVTGAIALFGTKPSWEMMTNCDPVIMI